MHAETVHLELDIPRPAKSVQSWWTELPDDYTARDPREQPFRIRTVRHLPEGRELETHWRAPDGSVRVFREVLRVEAPGRWTFDIPEHPLGFRIFDEFRAEPRGEATRLTIRSVIFAVRPGSAAHLAAQKERMEQGWRTAAELCARDAP